MPVHAPDHTTLFRSSHVVVLVSVINSVEDASLTGTLGEPEDQLARVVGRCEEFLLMRMPGCCINLLIVTLEAVELTICLSDVEYLELAVFATGKEPVTVDWVPSHNLDHVVMGLDLIDSLTSTSRIPQLDKEIFTSSQNE